VKNRLHDVDELAEAHIMQKIIFQEDFYIHFGRKPHDRKEFLKFCYRVEEAVEAVVNFHLLYKVITEEMKEKHNDNDTKRETGNSNPVKKQEKSIFDF